MAYEIPGFSWTLVAGEDLSDSQFCGVNIDTDGTAILPAAGVIAGVTRNKAVEGESATIVSTGIVMGQIGTGGVTAGDTVSCDTDGTFIAGGTVKCGRALKTNAAGEVGSILLLISADAA